MSAEPMPVTIDDPPPAGSPRRTQDAAAFAGTCLVILLCCLFPGLGQFAGDEATLLGNALRANHDGRLVDLGLGGSFDYTYGPLPTQMYQLLLLVSHDLRALVVIRTILVLGGTAAALWSIGRTLRLPLWFVPIAIASPWMWWFGRTLWDNTFCIPVGCAMLAAYARFLVKPSWRSSAGWALGATALPLIHLFATPLALVVFGHALLLRWGSFRRFLPAILCGILIASSTSWSYLQVLTRQGTTQISLWIGGYDGRPVVRDAPPRPGLPSRWVSASHSLWAATLLSARQDFYRPPEPPGEATPTTRLVAYTSLGVHAWFGSGLILAGVAIWRGIDPLRRSMLIVAVSALLVQAAMFATMRAAFHEHYLAGTFAASSVICWLGSEWLWRGPLRRILVAGPVLFTILGTVLTARGIAITGGDTTHYGPTLHNVIDLVGLLDHFGVASVRTNSDYVLALPQTLQVARALRAPTQSPGSLPATGVAWITLRNEFPGDARLMFSTPNLFIGAPLPTPDDKYPLVDVSTRR